MNAGCTYVSGFMEEGRSPSFFIWEDAAGNGVKMTVGDMIAQTRALNQGRYSDSQLMEWLSEADARIYEEVLCTHTGGDITWSPYENMGDSLIVPATFGELYRHFLDAKIYLAGGETNRYNNAATLYNTALSEYKKWYNRTHGWRERTNITF